MHIWSFFHINKKRCQKCFKKIWTLNIIPSLKGSFQKNQAIIQRACLSHNSHEIQLRSWNLRFFCFKTQKYGQSFYGQNKAETSNSPKKCWDFVDTIQEVTKSFIPLHIFFFWKKTSEIQRKRHVVFSELTEMGSEQRKNQLPRDVTNVGN